MCGRFTALSFDEVEQLFRFLEYSSPVNIEPDWPAAPASAPDASRDAFPRRDVPLIASEAGFPASVVTLRWGFFPTGDDAVYNTRIETASELPLWQDSWMLRHCVVPAWAFFEPHASELAVSPRSGKLVKRPYRFAPVGFSCLLMMGVWQEGCFSLVTTEAHPPVSGVHHRMPVLLDAPAARSWLDGGSKGERLAASSSVALAGAPVLPEAPRDEQLGLF